MKRASDSRFVRRAMPLVLAATLVIGAFVVDNVFATYYFYVNWEHLQDAADTAAMAGTNYLPTNRTLALKTAKQYAEMNGVSAKEIVASKVSPDLRSITISIKRKLPFYLTGAAIGLTARTIRVTGIARVSMLPGSHPIGRAVSASLVKSKVSGA